MSTHAERVSIAAGWLDENHPGWHHKIDPDTLNLWDPQCCIGGQLLGYPMAWEELNGSISRETGVSMAGVFVSDERFKPSWVNEIQARRVLDEVVVPDEAAEPAPALV